MDPDPPTRARDALLLASLGLVGALLLGEALIRMSGAVNPGPTGYAPVNTKRRWREPTNSRGYRDVERSLARPPGGHRIVSLGDSFAWGVGVSYEDAYPQRLERVLTRRRAEPWEVVNLARPGMNSAEEARQLADEGLAYDPDVVVLGYCLNDSEDETGAEARRAEDWEALRETRAHPAPTGLWRSALYRFVAGRLDATFENRRRIAAYQSMYRDDYPGWRTGRESLRTMATLCRRRGIPFVVVVFPLFGNPLGNGYPFTAIHAKVGSVAREAGARVIDLLPAYRGLRSDLLVVDGASDEHPNEIAHRIAATEIVSTLNELIP